MLYPLFCEYFLEGQTLGKMALKIKVIRIDGGKASLSAYLLRWLLSLVDVSLFSGMVAILTIAINGKGQRIGDLAAGTAVIKTQASIKLDHILTPDLAEDYQPKYPGTMQLTDRDIRTIHKVLASNNEALMEATSYKIESLLGVHNLNTYREFLVQIINDHQFYANRELP